MSPLCASEYIKRCYCVQKKIKCFYYEYQSQNVHVMLNCSVCPTFHSFIFRRHFILIRVALELESIPGTLCVSWEYTGMPGYHRAPCTHTNIHN